MKSTYKSIFPATDNNVGHKKKEKEESWVEVIALCASIFGAGFVWLIAAAVIGG